MSKTKNICAKESDKLTNYLNEEMNKFSKGDSSTFQMPKRFLDFRLQKLALGRQVNLWDLISPDH